MSPARSCGVEQFVEIADDQVGTVRAKRIGLADTIDADDEPEVPAPSRCDTGEGVFGSPFYIFQGEPFWGQDRLDFLEEAIARAVAAAPTSAWTR